MLQGFLFSFNKTEIMATFKKPTVTGKIISITKQGKTFNVYVPSNAYLKSKKEWDNQIVTPNTSKFGKRAELLTLNYHDYNVLRHSVRSPLIKAIFENNKISIANYKEGIQRNLNRNKQCHEIAHFHDVLEKPQVLNAMTVVH